MMRPEFITDHLLAEFIDQAIKEDLGEGDHTSLAALPPGAKRQARLIIKEEGILAGVSLAREIFLRYDPQLQINIKIEDGQPIVVGDVVFEISGNAHSVLSVERLVLNCMQRMSGIATHTNKLRTMISGSKARLMDTRKTTPNFRLAEKWAVNIGGGLNHRMGLYDMILLKDNHIDFAGGISNAIASVKKYLKNHQLDLKIEVETRNMEEVEEVLRIGGVDVIMLDNMTLEMLEKAVKLINGNYKTEASGGITEDTIAGVAASGVDFISVGALTHRVKSLDMSLKAF